MNILLYWTHDCPAPWQTSAWLEQTRQQSRANAYLRQIENRWVTSESTFIEMDWYDSCVDPELSPALVDPSLSVWIGVDTSAEKRQHRSCGCHVRPGQRQGQAGLASHLATPRQPEPLDFEHTIEKCLLDMRRRFWIREVRFDPHQMQSTSQRLAAAGLPMLEFPQTVSNLTEASTNLYELIEKVEISLPTLTMISAWQLADASPSRPAGDERIAKEKASHEIESIVASWQWRRWAPWARGKLRSRRS